MCAMLFSQPSPASPKKAEIFAIANQKGGVGKTTTAINLASALSERGKRVLLIDLDPQGNASTGLGIMSKMRPFSSKIWFSPSKIQNSPILKNILNTENGNFDLAPSCAELASIEYELAQKTNQAGYVRHALKNFVNSYDYILIDCPPALGLLTINALTAADRVIVPLQCEFFALEGLGHLLKTVARIQYKLNPELRIEGVLLTMYDQRNNLSALVARDVKKHLKNKVFETIIPRNVRVSEAPSHGKPILHYDQNCSGSLAYRALAQELLAA